MDGYAFDLQRIFFGDVPITFAFEIVFRTIIMYLYALALIRFVGQRGLGELSLFEFGIIIALGSAVGDPMFYADVPLLHGMIVLTTVVFLQRILVFFTNRNPRIERVIEGSPKRLVYNGVLDLNGMKRAQISRQELFMELRIDGITHLGQIRRAYIEADGKVSIFRSDEHSIKPGLPIVPPWDLSDTDLHKKGNTIAEMGDYSCFTCGYTLRLEHGEIFPTCSQCEHDEWVWACLDPLSDTRHATAHEPPPLH